MSWTGKTCDDYLTNNWCTADGGYGSAWGGTTFAKFKNFDTGYDASFCTVCGCKDDRLVNAHINAVTTTARPTVVAADDCSLDEAMKKLTDISFLSEYDHYIIKGSPKGSVIQVDTEDYNRKEYRLGAFTSLDEELHMTSYTGGTYCSPIHSTRRSTIQWSCGSKFEIINAEETSTCVYSFDATMPCCNMKDPHAWDPNQAPLLNDNLNSDKDDDDSADVSDDDSYDGDQEDDNCSLNDALDKLKTQSFQGEYEHYTIKGSPSGTLIQVDKNDWNEKEYSLGQYDSFDEEVETTYFLWGTYCSPIGSTRRSSIQWSCGSKFEIINAEETSTCVYSFKATMPCCNMDDPHAWDSNAASRVDDDSSDATNDHSDDVSSDGGSSDDDDEDDDFIGNLYLVLIILYYSTL